MDEGDPKNKNKKMCSVLHTYGYSVEGEYIDFYSNGIGGGENVSKVSERGEESLPPQVWLVRIISECGKFKNENIKMLTLVYLFVETWRLFWRPRATVVRKSSFRTLQRTERPVIPLRTNRQQQEDDEDTSPTNQKPLSSPSSWSADQTISESSCSPKSSPILQRHSIGLPPSPTTTTPVQQQQQSSSLSSGAVDDRKVVGRGIPIASKHIVPSVSAKPTQSEIPQPQVASPTKVSPPSQIPKPGQQQQQQQQIQQQQQQQQSAPPPQPPQQPSHIPTPVQKSVKTLVLEPSVSGNRMDENWAKKQIEKFSFGFDEADKDKSGSLSFDEVFNVLQKNGFKGSRTEAQFIFGHMDTDGNKTLSRDEFNAAMKAVPRIVIREFAYRKAFKQLDKDNSGFLTKTEIADATKSQGGVDIGDKVIAELLIYVTKKDANQQVDYEEFLRVLGIEAAATVMYRVFKAIDADGSGFLTKEEMLDAISNEFELKLSMKLIAQLLIDLVKDADHKMSYDEFVQSWRNRKEEVKK